ncbi:hypothetical protein L1049_001496 [Liquidambar formosana]|uniref:Uncharacterized protein n=1 Tax=Liquidambar formosana TaxID=63359 RepID=A0AAP0NB65_LIQFO
MREVVFRQSDIRRRFYELNVGDPSGNIIEMIFQAASTNPSKQSREIKRILRVKNLFEVLERRHPRSMVDGNELLRFYSTTMTCCTGKPNWVSELCKESTCGVCRTIQSNFDMEYTKNRIQWSTSSEALSETMIANSKGKNVKRGIVVAGR